MTDWVCRGGNADGPYCQVCKGLNGDGMCSNDFRFVHPVATWTKANGNHKAHRPPNDEESDEGLICLSYGPDVLRVHLLRHAATNLPKACYPLLRIQRPLPSAFV